MNTKNIVTSFMATISLFVGIAITIFLKGLLSIESINRLLTGEMPILEIIGLFVASCLIGTFIFYGVKHKIFGEEED